MNPRASSDRSVNDKLAFVVLAARRGAAAARRGLSVGERQAAQWCAWAETHIHEAVVLYEKPGHLRRLKPAAGAAVGKTLRGMRLILDRPSHVGFKGAPYSMKRPGLYRFVTVGRSVRNVILADRASPLPLLESLGLLQVHGMRHDRLSPEGLRRMLLREPWISVSCGRVADLAVALLREGGFEARKVFALTAGQWGHDNAHSLVEVRLPDSRRWVLADVDMGRLFKHGPKLLNAFDVWQRLRSGRTVTPARWIPKQIDPFMSWPGRFNYSLYLQKVRWTDEASVRTWYGRILQILAFREEDRLWCLDPTGVKAREYYGRSSVCIPDAACWRRRFYG